MVALTSMRLTALVAAALTTLTSAQTPPGFSPAPVNNATLGVAFGSNVVSPPGELIPRPETANPPTISTTLHPTTSSRAILFLIDQDVPRNNSRVTLLHWFVPNILLPVTTTNTTTTSTQLTPLPIPPVTNITGGAPYLQPSPPVGDIPHRYVFLLFNQPANFAIPAGFDISPPPSTDQRIGFNVSDFAIKAGLGTPVEGNWITVQNLTGIASATGSATGVRPTGTAGVMPYTGAAAATSGKAGWGLLVAGVAGVVGFML